MSYSKPSLQCIRKGTSYKNESKSLSIGQSVLISLLKTEIVPQETLLLLIYSLLNCVGSSSQGRVTATAIFNTFDKKAFCKENLQKYREKIVLKVVSCLIDFLYRIE